MQAVTNETLTLEPLTREHAEEMFDVLADPAIYEYENEPPLSVEWLRSRYARLESRWSPDGVNQWLNWAVRLPTQECIGFVQATVHRDRSASIAYVFSPAHWGKGLGTHAVREMLFQLESRFFVTSFKAVLKEDNIRSYRLLLRCGFSLATPAEHDAQVIPGDEILMTRRNDSARFARNDEMTVMTQ